MKKKIIWAILIVLVVIQFIRPEKNQSTQISANDISKHYEVPAHVQDILKRACNDCHSNNTLYPWYSNIQPMAWWLQHHVNEGKRELNFSEFASYQPKRQHHKLKECIDQVKNGEMPLDSYTWMHKDAKLTKEEKEALLVWAGILMEQIAAKYNLEP
jgi:hypothetical protein